MLAGLLSQADVAVLVGDPEVTGLVKTLVGGGVAAAAELFYYLAKKYGWKT